MRSAGKVLDNVVEILRLYFGVPALFRIQHDVRSLLAGAEAHVRLDFDILNALSGDFFFQLGRELFRAARFTIDVLANQANSSHYVSPCALITRPATEMQQRWLIELHLG